MLIPKITTEIVKSHSEFQGARIAVIHLLHLSILVNHATTVLMVCCYDKARSAPLPPFWKGRGASPPALRRPWIQAKLPDMFA